MGDARCDVIDPVRDTDSVFPGHARYPFVCPLGDSPPGGENIIAYFQGKFCNIIVTFSIRKKDWMQTGARGLSPYPPISMFAAKYGRDTEVSSGLVSVTTLLSIVTMPPIIALAMTIL